MGKSNKASIWFNTKKLIETLLGKNAQNSMLKNLFKDNVLGLANKGTSPGNKDKKDKPELKLKEFPTYMKVNKIDASESSETVTALPINGKLSLKITTDVSTITLLEICKRRIFDKNKKSRKRGKRAWW